MCSQRSHRSWETFCPTIHPKKFKHSRTVWPAMRNKRPSSNGLRAFKYGKLNKKYHGKLCLQENGWRAVCLILGHIRLEIHGDRKASWPNQECPSAPVCCWQWAIRMGPSGISSRWHQRTYSDWGRITSLWVFEVIQMLLTSRLRYKPPSKTAILSLQKWSTTTAWFCLLRPKAPLTLH